MEEWKDIADFPGYQVSNYGQVRSFWKRTHYPTGYGCFYRLSSTPHIIAQSNDGNGYMKLMLYNHYTGARVCRKVHRLVAEAFLPPPPGGDYTVDHIESGPIGKLDNSIWNLRWVTRSENIKKAYRDGVCDARIARQNKPIVSTDLWTGEQRYFDSIGDAAYELGIDRSSISHVLNGDYERTNHYVFEYAGREDILLYGYRDDPDY